MDLTYQKILTEVIILEAHFAEGLKIATTLRAQLEGEVKPTPSSLRKKEMIAHAVNARNIKIRAKTTR